MSLKQLKRFKLRFFLPVVIALATTLFFQNCMKGFNAQNFGDSKVLSSSAPSCSFNSQSLIEGDTITAYLTDHVPTGQTCVSETRACHNGFLSGSYNYPSCLPIAPTSCIFNSKEVVTGGTAIGYVSQTVPLGHLCTDVAQTVTCTNGTLSPQNLFATCTPATSTSCTLAGLTIPNGSFIPAYQFSSVPSGQTCVAETRTCTNGVLSGSFANTTCAVAAGSSPSDPAVASPPASCYYNGAIVADGGSVQGYSASLIPFGTSCSAYAITATCHNGVLQGSDGSAVTDLSSTCRAATTSTCSYVVQNEPFSTRNHTLQSGQTVSGYSATSIPEGNSCSSVQTTLSCNGGVLSINGVQSFNYYLNSFYSACNVGSCFFGGKTVLDQQLITAYTAPYVAYGQSCSTVQEQLKCNNQVIIDASTGAIPSSPSATCSAKATSTCTITNWAVGLVDTVLQSGQTLNGFSKESVLESQTCGAVQENLSCNGGLLSVNGGVKYDTSGIFYFYSQCNVGACKLGGSSGQTILDNQSITAYSAAIVPFGSACSSVADTVTCKNSALVASSGANASSFSLTCSPAATASCTFTNWASGLTSTTVQNGQTLSGFSQPTGSTSSPCSSAQLTLACSNGLISVNSSTAHDPSQLGIIRYYPTCQ